MTLAQQFAAYHEWRNQLAGGLSDFRRWLSDNELCDAQTDQRIDRLLEKLREDRLHVAFVAEFSRGKSELINAIFFAYYGNRMLPSTAGRTTMCPTELMYDMSKPACIELLPIETREAEDGSALRRRRRCGQCDKRFTTYETVELRLPQVVVAVSPRSLLRWGFDQLYIKAPELDVRRDATDGCAWGVPSSS